MDMEAVVTLASTYKSSLCQHLEDHSSVFIFPAVFENSWKAAFLELGHYVVELLKMPIRNCCLYCHCITNEKCLSVIQNLGSTKMGSSAVV